MNRRTTIILEWAICCNIKSLCGVSLLLFGEIESSIFGAAPTLHSTMAYPKPARLSDWAIHTTATVTDTTSSFPSTILDKELMHTPSRIRAPEADSSREGPVLNAL